MYPLNTTAIIFDLGKVLVSFDHDRCYQTLATTMGTSASTVKKVVEESIRPQFDRGEMSIDEVHSTLEDRIGGAIDREKLLHAWADVFDPIPEMLSWLQSLHGRVRLALLSNTDAIHLPWVKTRFGFLSLFDHLILSYEVGATKPDPAIYQTALKRLDLPAAACCYIDDIKAYADAARALNMMAVHHRSPTKTLPVVEEWLASMQCGP